MITAESTRTSGLPIGTLVAVDPGMTKLLLVPLDPDNIPPTPEVAPPKAVKKAVKKAVEKAVEEMQQLLDMGAAEGSGRA